MDNSNSTINDNTFVAGTDSGADDVTDEQIMDMLKGMTYDEFIENYAEGLIYEQGMGKLDKDLQEDLKKDIIERINAEINSAIADALPDDKLDEFSKMAEGGNVAPEEMQKYLADAGVDVGAVTAKAFEKVHQDFVGEYAGALDAEE